jgi:hypothetical protein
MRRYTHRSTGSSVVVPTILDHRLAAESRAMTTIVSTAHRAGRRQLFDDIAVALQGSCASVTMRDDTELDGIVVAVMASRLFAMVILRDTDGMFPPPIYWLGYRLNPPTGGPTAHRSSHATRGYEAVSLSTTYQQLVDRLAVGFFASRDGADFHACTRGR